MAKIKATPELLTSLSAQLCRHANEIEKTGKQMHGAICQLDWELRQRSQIEMVSERASQLAQTLASEANRMAKFVEHKAQELEQADQRTQPGPTPAPTPKPSGAEYSSPKPQERGQVDRNNQPIPGPTPTPTTSIPEDAKDGSASKATRQLFDFVDEWSTPFDWIGEHKKASHQFHLAMQQLGRTLNDLGVGGKRGNIKRLDALASLMEGDAKYVSALGDVLALNDFRHYFSGGLTNSEICRQAIDALLPIPVLKNKVADWAVAKLPFPNGHWRGLIPPAYSE